MAETVKVLGFAGSLRQGSYNAALLNATRELAPAGMTVEAFGLHDIPLYNEDVRQAGLPEAVTAFRDAIAGADALLIVTPEYNFSVPGVLKNAIDWASRPPDQPFDGKPLAIMSAAGGRLGGARAQYHLRQCFVFLNAHVLNRPEVMIGGVREAFDDDGRLIDDKARDIVVRQLEALRDFAGR